VQVQCCREFPCLPQRLAAWETRERRKANEYGKEFEKEGDRRKEMVRTCVTCVSSGTALSCFVIETDACTCIQWCVSTSYFSYLSVSCLVFQEREKRHLAEFLEDYDDERDDQRYYR